MATEVLQVNLRLEDSEPGKKISKRDRLDIHLQKSKMKVMTVGALFLFEERNCLPAEPRGPSASEKSC
jgi:hypothetical protein